MHKRLKLSSSTEGHGGKIINAASQAGVVGSFLTVYGGTKFAPSLVGIAQTLATWRLGVLSVMRMHQVWWEL